MGDILDFRKPAPRGGKGSVLCQNGHHKWKVCKEKQFDTRAGKLVTVMRCERCNAQKVTTT
jgi:hypothetical protein